MLIRKSMEEIEENGTEGDVTCNDTLKEDTAS